MEHESLARHPFIRLIARPRLRTRTRSIWALVLGEGVSRSMPSSLESRELLVCSNEGVGYGVLVLRGHGVALHELERVNDIDGLFARLRW